MVWHYKCVPRVNKRILSSIMFVFAPGSGSNVVKIFLMFPSSEVCTALQPTRKLHLEVIDWIKRYLLQLLQEHTFAYSFV